MFLIIPENFYRRTFLFVISFFIIILFTACHNEQDNDAEISPVALMVEINQPVQPNQQVTASYQYQDYGSPEGESLYEWYVGSELLANTLAFLLPSNSEGQQLMFCITPVPAYAPSKKGEKVCDSLAILGEYNLPTAENVNILGEITTGVDLMGEYDFVDDKNRQEGESEYLWTLNSEPIFSYPNSYLSKY